MNFKKENIEKLLNGAVAFAKTTTNKTVTYLSRSKELMGNKIKNIDTQSISLKNIHFNFHHFVSVVMVALFAFLVTFYSTSFNTKEVSAAGISAPEVVTFNEKPIDVSYGDTKAIANIAKDILENEVSAVSELKTVSSSVGTGVYTLDDYVITVTLDQVALGEGKALLTIEDKNTYKKSENEKVVVSAVADSDIITNSGSSYTYQIALNIIDTNAPVITLTKNEVTIKDTDDFDVRDYVESVVDNVDGSIDFNVEGEVTREDDKYVANDYTLIIKAKDASGNEASAELKVIVEESEEEVVETTTSDTNRTYGNYAQSPYAGSIVAEARSHVGKAYVYGAAGPNAFDCSGLVQYVFARSGISIPRTSGSQATVGVAINPNDISQWRAGDIVTFGPGGSSHAAIYSGNGTFIHALNPSQGVMETGIYGFGTIYSVRRVQ